jgi:hypothetical protein
VELIAKSFLVPFPMLIMKNKLNFHGKREAFYLNSSSLHSFAIKIVVFQSKKRLIWFVAHGKNLQPEYKRFLFFLLIFILFMFLSFFVQRINAEKRKVSISTFPCLLSQASISLVCSKCTSIKNVLIRA